MMKKILFVALLLIMVTHTNGYSQNNQHIGISGTIQGAQYGLTLPIWMGQKFALAPSIDLRYVEDTGVDFNLAIAPRYYFKRDKLATYMGIRLGVLTEHHEINQYYYGAEVTYDYMGGVCFGGDYFLAEQLSVGVEAQGNFVKSDDHSSRFGNPGGINFNLATMVNVTIWF